ncbi:MAG: N-6 DNA methylase, partial [Tissierellales bacterium]|nr:N-6 DNA methylase [Tissierellales bacterium]
MGQLNENLSKQKLRGGYYTPQVIADFLCKWSINPETKSVLEPSCGDGSFIESAINRFKDLNVDATQIEKRIKGIELIDDEALKAEERTKLLGLKKSPIINSDFFHF